MSPRTLNKLLLGLYLALGIILILGVALLFVPFPVLSNEFATFSVKVIDRQTQAPVTGAEVGIHLRERDISEALGLRGAFTDKNGEVEFVHPEMARSNPGGRAKVLLGEDEALIVRAKGFKEWKRSLTAVFGSAPEFPYGERFKFSTVVSLERE